VCGLVEAMRGGGGRGRGGRCGVDPMGERSMEVGFGSGVPVAGQQACRKKIAGRGAVPSGGRATGGEATGAEVFTYQICSPLHSF
jgi:hypothetical protein